MAQDTVDKAIEIFPDKLIPKSNCQTKCLLLEEAQGWSSTIYIRLMQDFGLEPQVANHLSNTYSDRAFAVAKIV